jgi:hypothetical protein
MGQLAGRNLRLECFGWRKNRRITPNLEHFPDLLVPQKLRQANSFRQATVPLDPVHPSTRLWLTGGFATATCPASLLIVLVLCPNLAPTPSCRHSDQERNGISAAPHAMCIGSASQEDGPSFPCGRGDSPWARSRNLVGTTSNAGSPCCPRTEARQPRSRMDHSPTPPRPKALAIEWDPPCRCPRYGLMMLVVTPFPASGKRRPME